MPGKKANPFARIVGALSPCDNLHEIKVRLRSKGNTTPADKKEGFVGDAEFYNSGFTDSHKSGWCFGGLWGCEKKGEQRFFAVATFAGEVSPRMFAEDKKGLRAKIALWLAQEAAK